MERVGLEERAQGWGVLHLTGCGVGLGFSQKEGGEEEGRSRREGSGVESGTPDRLWCRASRD